MAEKKDGSSGKLLLVFVILVFVIFMIFGALMVFVLHIPIIAILIIGMFFLFIAMAFVLILVFMGKKKPLDLSKRDYEKTLESSLLSCNPALYDKPIFLRTGTPLGKIKGSAEVTNDDTGEDEIVILVDAGGGLLSFLPFFKKQYMIKLDPKLISDTSALDIVIDCISIKRLDNYFLHPIFDLKKEVLAVKKTTENVYRELTFANQDKIGEMSEKSMKSNPTYLQRKDSREGGLFSDITSKLRGDEDE